MGKVSKIFKKSKSPISMKNHLAMSVSSYLSPLSRFFGFCPPLMYSKSLSLRKSFIKWEFQKFFENLVGLKKFIFLGMFSWMDFHLLKSIQTFSTLFFIRKSWIFMENVCENFKNYLFIIIFQFEFDYFSIKSSPKWRLFSVHLDVDFILCDHKFKRRILKKLKENGFGFGFQIPSKLSIPLIS